MNIPEESRSAFITCTFSMLGKIAAADGEVSPEELEKVEEYIDKELELDQKTKILALKVFEDAMSSPLELRDYAEKFGAVFQNRVQLLDKTVQILLELSAADGVILPEEEKLVRSAALLLGLNLPGYERIKSTLGFGASEPN